MSIASIVCFLSFFSSCIIDDGSSKKLEKKSYIIRIEPNTVQNAKVIISEKWKDLNGQKLEPIGTHYEIEAQLDTSGNLSITINEEDIVNFILINFSLTEAVKVTIEIYNSAGKNIVVLVNDFLAAGIHSIMWDTTGL